MNTALSALREETIRKGRLRARDKSAEAAESYRGFARDGWRRAAEHYHDFWSALTQQAVEPMLDALGVSKGSSLLDVACGAGHIAAAGVSRGAIATGIDYSDAALRIATRLHPQSGFAEADAEELPFAAGSFTAVGMNFVIHHLAYPMRALNEARRVLRPGGRVAFSVWAAPDRARGAGIVYAAIKQHGTLQVPLPPAPPLWRLDSAEDGCRVMRSAALDDAVAIRVAQTWVLDSADDFFAAFYDGSVRTKALLRAQTSRALEAIRRAVGVSLQAYERAGRLEVPMDAVIVSARKPADER